MKQKSWTVTLPVLDVFDSPLAFTLRNEIPRAFGSQAGNTEVLQNRMSLEDRFFYSLIPKAEVTLDDRSYSIFREGCPYHLVMQNAIYTERPDIIFLQGVLDKGYPVYNNETKELKFSFTQNDATITGVFKVKNSPGIPLTERTPPEGATINVNGIIECSVNKAKEFAIHQIVKYIRIFALDEECPKVALITGNELNITQYLCHSINVRSSDQNEIISQCSLVAKDVVKFLEL